MKTKLLLLVVLFVLSLTVIAQTIEPVSSKAVRIGIKGGVNFANVNITVSEMSVSLKSYTGFYGGIVADFNLKESLYLNTGLLYSLKGFKLSGAELDVPGDLLTMELNYLDIPINLAYKFKISETSKFFIQAGPYFGYALSGKEKAAGESMKMEFGVEGGYKRVDYGLGFGGGLEFGSVVTSLNYQVGMANIYNGADATIKNKVFQISLAYMFGK